MLFSFVFVYDWWVVFGLKIVRENCKHKNACWIEEQGQKKNIRLLEQEKQRWTRYVSGQIVPFKQILLEVTVTDLSLLK